MPYPTGAQRALLLAILLLLACSPPIAAPPAATLAPTGAYTGPFNNHDQGHADFCVRLRQPVVQLRYADGAPTGFVLTDSLLEPVAGNGVSCPDRGLARLDAREVVRDSAGRALLFHRGGWGFVGNDPASAVHFGHVLASDVDTAGVMYFRVDTVPLPAGTPRGRWQPALTAPWSGRGQQAGNGSACSEFEPAPYRVVVHSIPGDMRYLNSARTNAIPYAIYGSPAEDLGPPQDRARGIRYTMLTWSWINVRGGGVARALVRDGASFRRCRGVPAIRLASVADPVAQQRTGWVEAVYGAIDAGDGTPLFGWIVAAHAHGAGDVVHHLVR